jgi:hypothetical protein
MSCSPTPPWFKARPALADGPIMLDLPLWAQVAMALAALVFVLSFLRSLAAYILDVIAIHTLKCDIAAIKIRQLKQLRALQEGIHPGDIFADESILDNALESVLANQAHNDQAHDNPATAELDDHEPARRAA